MLGGHLPELFAVVIIGLLLFGPKRLPEVGSSLGQSIRSFRHGLSEIDGQPEHRTGSIEAVPVTSNPTDHQAK
ncbi:MAG TPA: twin-arginine translocase TatA/TatE family subunit [Chloroflexota bacterium]|nr:twin-arginine translocase TatA/TatE family subunit [Chloroflexota bacterium]